VSSESPPAIQLAAIEITVTCMRKHRDKEHAAVSTALATQVTKVTMATAAALTTLA